MEPYIVNSDDFFAPRFSGVSGLNALRSASQDAALAALAKAVEGGDETIDLSLAALLVSVSHYPSLDVEAYLRQLEALAQGARARIGNERRADQTIAALNAYLFEELGFRGNVEDYYNPANSFLHEVLDTRRGLPITLSILYIAVAQRVGLTMRGVGLPLHFIARCDSPWRSEHQSEHQPEDPSANLPADETAILIDPFYGGEILTPRHCRERIEGILGHPIAFDPAYLQPTPNRLILYRLLNNLKQIYVQREEPSKAGRVVEQMLVVVPDSVEDMRDRGLLFLQEGAFSRAVAWLTRYLERLPDAEDADHIQNAIRQAHVLRAQLN